MPVKIPQSLRTMLEDKAYGHVVRFNAQGKPELDYLDGGTLCAAFKARPF